MIEFKGAVVIGISMIAAVVKPSTKLWITDVYYQKSAIQCLKMENYEVFCHPGYPADCYATINGTPYLLYGDIAINGLTCIYPLKMDE